LPHFLFCIANYYIKNVWIFTIKKEVQEESTPTWYPPKVSKDTKTGRYNLSKISRSKGEEKPCWQITY